MAAAVFRCRLLLRAAGRAVADLARDWTPDVLLLGGAASVSYGAWLIAPPAGFIVGGVLLIAGGVIASRGAR